MKVGELLKVSRDDIQDFPGDTIDLIMSLQKEGWRAQRSNRNHVMLLAPDKITKYSASRNANSAKYLREDIARYKRGEQMLGEEALAKMEKEIAVPAHEKFPCPQADCPRFYASQEKVNVHVAVDHEGWVKCPNCDEVRDTVRSLSHHRRSIHGYVSPRYQKRKAQEANRKAKEVLDDVIKTVDDGHFTQPAPIGQREKDLKEITKSMIDDTIRAAASDLPWSTEDAKVVRTDDLEFIDSRDSWVLDHRDIADRRIGTLEQILRATGLNMEIRVWKEEK